MGTLLAPVGQNCCQTHAQYLHFVVLLFLFPGFYQRMQFLSYEFLTSDISKPSRQLADSWITANWLNVRILQQKTRQSDSFFHFSVFRQFRRWQPFHLSRYNIDYTYLMRFERIHSQCSLSVASLVQCSLTGVMSEDLGQRSTFHTA